jgi:hypothetical protein
LCARLRALTTCGRAVPRRAPPRAIPGDTHITVAWTSRGRI